jgi:hypothetical protein
VDVDLSSSSGETVLAGPGILMKTPTGPTRLKATFTPDQLPEWAQAMANQVRTITKGFELVLDLAKDGASGRFSVLGQTIERCDLARVPADDVCGPNERVASESQIFHGVTARDIVEASADLQKAKTFLWDSTGERTQLTLEFVPLPGAACLGDFGAESSFLYAIPGTIHAFTSDGRVDVRLAGRASATGAYDAWGPVSIGTAGPTPVDENSRLGFPDLGERLAVVQLSSSRESVLPDGTTFDFGGMAITAVELKSAEVEPEGALCFAKDFFGIATTLAVGNYAR